MVIGPSPKPLVEPEVVATSPDRIKSPVPVYCGFSSEKWWAREDLHLQGSQTLDLRGLLFPLNHSPENYFKLEPPAGAAPARFLYKRNPQAAARRRKWPAGRSPKSEGWSQSPVLPWAQRAYETCLSAGSTAVLPHGHKTGAPTRSGLPKSCKSGAHKRRSLREKQCTEVLAHGHQNRNS